MDLRLGKRRRSNEEETEGDDWSSIPNDILRLISQKIGGSIKEYVRFSSVCRSWHSFATDSANKPPGFGPLYVDKYRESKHITLRNPASDETLTLDLPEIGANGRRYYWGSPFGWLIALDNTHINRNRISLLNPFTGASIAPVALPDLPGDWANDSQRISGFLTASPDSDPDNCLVVIVSGSLNSLAFVKPGGDWNYRHLPWNSEYCEYADFHGATYFKGNLYGIYRHTQVVSFQPNSRHGLAHVTYLNLCEDMLTHSSSEYLVDLDGQLCLCVRYHRYSEKCVSTVDFKICSINVSTGNLTPLRSLGDRCVFLDVDRSYSFSYKASYPPSKLFERHQYTYDEFVSNYVFFNDSVHGLQVWDMLHSCDVCKRNVPSWWKTSSFWILRPLN